MTFGAGRGENKEVNWVIGFWLIVVATNLVVDAFVGLMEVTGFLLPIVYTGPLAVGVIEELALNFAASIVSGALGLVNYNRAGNLDIPSGIRLSLGSLVGAILGVELNLVVPESVVRILLYMMVPLSDISIFLRKDRETKDGRMGYVISEHLAATLVLGLVIGAICTLSRAGGPVLVMPLLVVLGIGIRTAVDVSPFNSVFISIPACIGYMMQCNIKPLLSMMVAALMFHAVRMAYGSRNAIRINQVILKKGIAVFLILITIWKLSSQLL